MTWWDVLDVWELVTLDLADLGVDVWDRHLMRTRPGLWLRSIVTGLMTRPPLGYRDVPAGQDREGQPLTRPVPIWPNRVQKHFFAPLFRT